ncbi:MAG: DoxX family protein [Gammaproteobacteria bacterium]|nr:DoxX family protein [Gammaproteobacteria bacterium]
MSPLLLERLFISLVFGLSGLAKLAGMEFEVAAFERWGFPLGAMYAIGVFELLGALGIWIDRMSAFVGLCLCALASGAILTQVVHGDWIMACVTAVILLVVCHYTWRQRDELFPSDRNGDEPPPPQ